MLLNLIIGRLKAEFDSTNTCIIKENVHKIFHEMTVHAHPHGKQEVIQLTGKTATILLKIIILHIFSPLKISHEKRFGRCTKVCVHVC